MSAQGLNTSKSGFQCVYLGVAQKVVTSGSSVLASNFQSNTTVIWLFATQDAFFEISANPTATSSSHFLAGGIYRAFAVPQGHKLALIQSTTSGTVYITEGY